MKKINPVEFAKALADETRQKIALGSVMDSSIHRAARARGVSIEQIEKLIREGTEPRDWDFLGEPRVNVLALNLARAAG